MLSPQIRELVKATAPVLKVHGVALTKHFYARMFQHNPELKHVFNQAHQAGGAQQHALAGAVTAYAEHIDDPSVLMPVVTRIVHKHVSRPGRRRHGPSLPARPVCVRARVRAGTRSDAAAPIQPVGRARPGSPAHLRQARTGGRPDAGGPRVQRAA